MPLRIIAAQTFTDKRNIEHTSMYGRITDIRFQPARKFITIRIDFFNDEAESDLGDFNSSIVTFSTAFSQSDFDDSFADSVLLLVSKSLESQAEAVMLAKESSPGVKLIDDTIFELIP